VTSRPPTPFLKTLLVGTDFSVCSARALSYAVSLALSQGARLHIVHVLSEPVQPLDVVGALPYIDAGTRAEWQKTAEDRLGKECRASEKRGVKSSCEVIWGRPSDALVSRAEETKASLLVIGTHGRSAIEQLLLGSTAERIVRRSTVPVLTVREKK
jgi:nucleotide-binding universal stress UspA family protein